MESRQAELDIALELAAWASGRILARPVEVTTKANAADHVTETDREVEQHVRAVIAERLPGQVVVGEEYGGEAAADGGATWYLDPVDGTTNYAHGLPWSSFSLALIDADGPAVAVVADPYRGEVFSASRGGPALRNGEPIRCRATETLSGEVVTTEWLGYRPWTGMDAFLAKLSGVLCSTRIMGSTALSLVSVAAGRAAGCVIGRYNAIDGLAAAFIAERAGALALDESRNRTVFPQSGGILVAAPGVAGALWDAWAPSGGLRHV
jgi:fructose-1,6-bisphosphatase/inositol monophosphatase family enzyme